MAKKYRAAALTVAILAAVLAAPPPRRPLNGLVNG